MRPRGGNDAGVSHGEMFLQGNIGRSMKDLGIQGLSVEQIKSYLNSGEKQVAWKVISMTCELLLVDDERQLVDVMAQRLVRRGFAVTCAYRGQEALDRLDEQAAVDVVILDVKMPGMDGVGRL